MTFSPQKRRGRSAAEPQPKRKIGLAQSRQGAKDTRKRSSIDIREWKSVPKKFKKLNVTNTKRRVFHLPTEAERKWSSVKRAATGSSLV
jgi:hypothetical protein